MSDVRHHPITMRMTAHEYSLSCLCDSCQATLKKQSTCKHSMIGKQPICVHCGASDSLASSIAQMQLVTSTAKPSGASIKVNVPPQYQAKDWWAPSTNNAVVSSVTYNERKAFEMDESPLPTWWDKATMQRLQNALDGI